VTGNILTGGCDSGCHTLPRSERADFLHKEVARTVAFLILRHDNVYGLTVRELDTENRPNLGLIEFVPVFAFYGRSPADDGATD